MPRIIVEVTQPLDIENIASQSAQDAQRTCQRRMLVLAGDVQWCRESAERCLQAAGISAPVWLSRDAPGGARQLDSEKAASLLGSDVPALVMNAHEGFDPDALGAAVGAVTGGGLVLLLTPPLAEWPRLHDPQNQRVTVAPYPPESVSGRFLQRLANICRSHKQMLCIEQGKTLSGMPADPGSVPPVPVSDGSYRTPDQRTAVEQVMKTATGHRRRPTLLVSDRGRGKSAAFGIAAARLMKQGKRTLVVTAPRLSAVVSLYRHAAAALPDAQQRPGMLTWRGARLLFMAPDELVATAPDADLALVDEAAGIPLSLLTRLVQQQSRIAFASTVYGYEGTGRGFQLKFPAVLDAHAPGWQRVDMHTPIRWAEHDPVEQFVFDALLLNARIAEVESTAPQDCRWVLLDRDALAKDEALLGQVFGLLVMSHYRTRPFDLRHLLDGPNIEVHVLLHDDQVVATALVAREGGLDDAIATEIFAGRRRLRGHLLPQSMVTHVGIEAAASQHFGRIMRIAVHPELQGQGLGTQLLEAVVAHCAREGMDWVGTCFGITVELLNFWQRSDFVPVRVGLSKEASSGSHAGLLLRPLSAVAQTLLAPVRVRYADHLLHLLGDAFRDLDPVLVRRLITTPGEDAVPVELADAQWREIAAFACAQRGFEDSAYAVFELTRQVLGHELMLARLDEMQLSVLVKRVLQRRDGSDIAVATGLAGKAAVVDCLRAAVKCLLLASGDGRGRACCEDLEHLAG